MRAWKIERSSTYNRSLLPRPLLADAPMRVALALRSPVEAHESVSAGGLGSDVRPHNQKHLDEGWIRLVAKRRWTWRGRRKTRVFVISIPVLVCVTDVARAWAGCEACMPSWNLPTPICSETPVALCVVECGPSRYVGYIDCALCSSILSTCLPGDKRPQDASLAWAEQDDYGASLDCSTASPFAKQIPVATAVHVQFVRAVCLRSADAGDGQVGAVAAASPHAVVTWPWSRRTILPRATAMRVVARSSSTIRSRP